MDEQIDINNNQSFVQRLAHYYSEFLGTDFKKGSVPKRRFQSKDKLGRRNGISLEKFPSFIPKITKLINKEFSKNSSIIIKNNEHKANLPVILVSAMNACIESLEFKNLQLLNIEAINKFKVAIKKIDCDLEIECSNLFDQLRRNVGLEIGVEIVRILQPTFAKSGANLIDSLISVENDIAELFVYPFEEALPAAVADLIGKNSDKKLMKLLDEVFSEVTGKRLLKSFFDGFSSGDLFTELNELASVEQLEDNLEFYLYLGEIKYNAYKFPLFYIPFKLKFDGPKVELTLEPRVLINKKAIDYVARIIREETKTTGASVVENRIIYVSPDDTISDLIEGNIQSILRAFQFEGEISFNQKKQKIKNSIVTLDNTISFALFDKSDESMLTDYEELLDKLSEGSGKLFGFLNGLIDNFLEENPNTIIEEILDEWDDTKTPERLVFDTPIPLAEEQRKILSAINNKEGKFITVEGPPGTGKSHTISAIAFDAILKGKSILILSDKKEALDVVENKLNETLGKVRPSDEFINPILRLGRVGSNFKKITSTKSVESLRLQNREIRKDESERTKRYESAVKNLKENIKSRAKHTSKINTTAIFDLESEISEYFQEWQDDENFQEIFTARDDDCEKELLAISSLTDLIDICRNLSAEFVDFSYNFGDDAEALSRAITLYNLIRDGASNSGLFDIAPEIDFEKLELLTEKINELKSSKGILGYLFASKKILQIKNDLLDLVGLNIKTSNGNIVIEEIENLIAKANNFYKPIIEDFNDELHLIPDILAMGDDDSFVAEIDLENQLLDLQNSIDENEIPFLGEEELIIDVLTDTDSDEADFYETFERLRNESKEIEIEFESNEYSYLLEKKEIENYNALKLATEIDKRVIEFADQYKNDAKTLSKIIQQKKKFPKDKFDILKSSFPCMICSLRDYAEYIPLEEELFDIVIIDEASQVSIAQAFPAIIRAKKMVVLGDRKQFGNVKTTNASKELNSAYFAKVKAALTDDKKLIDTELEVKTELLNIRNSILDFMEGISNFSIMLKKHFRGYPEMISFSSKYFYGNSLQAMKLRGKNIDNVLEFVAIEDDGKFDKYKNTNHLEAEAILERVIEQLNKNDLNSVAVITPFKDQQAYISKLFSEHDLYPEMLSKLKFRCFTFDSCQGEERDYIYYSFVASSNVDKLWTILPKQLNQQDEEELDRNLRMQRLNVAFSRGKEKLFFVHSKPVSEFSAGREVLNHYTQVIAKAKAVPAESSVDPNSEAEKKVLKWIQQTPIYTELQPEIIPQFDIGDYLKRLDSKYNHPSYRVDFLLRFNINEKQRDIILEYDGFEFHFTNRDEIDAGNWKYYLTEKDVEREHVLEGYGYKMLRINKFNVGIDPIQTLSDRISKVLSDYEDSGDALIEEVLIATEAAHEGFKTGTYRHCKKCDQNRPTQEFVDKSTISGFRRFCKTCTGDNPRKKSRKKSRKNLSNNRKRCPNCSKSFPLSEFIDRSNKSGKRRLCGSCKVKSDQIKRDNYHAFRNRYKRW